MAKIISMLAHRLKRLNRPKTDHRFRVLEAHELDLVGGSGSAASPRFQTEAECYAFWLRVRDDQEVWRASHPGASPDETYEAARDIVRHQQVLWGE